VLVFATGLAISPAFVAISRSATGYSLGLTFIAFAIFAWREGKSSWLGIFSAMALLSNTSIFLGLFIFLLFWFGLVLIARRGQLGVWLSENISKWNAAINFKYLGLSFLLTVFVSCWQLQARCGLGRRLTCLDVCLVLGCCWP
jgi:hypothetical protein